MSSDLDRDALVRLFLEESEEGLVAIEQALVTLEASPQDTGVAPHAVPRRAHPEGQLGEPWASPSSPRSRTPWRTFSTACAPARWP